MGKPKIIGYKTNHELPYPTPSLPEMTYDSDGISIPWTYLDNYGNPFEAPRYLTNREVDQLMRECGMKPLYEERQFHASLVLDLYHVYCKNCMTTTITNPEHLPHDTASRHRCLYSPGER